MLAKDCSVPYLEAFHAAAHTVACNPLEMQPTPMKHGLWLAVAVCLLLPMPLIAQAANDAATLNAGDAVRIEVWRQPELSGEFEVTGSGVVGHPLYRQISVTGLPIDEVESAIEGFLVGFEASPQFVVEALFRIAVGGEVRQPDVYSLRPETTVSQAIALAGGPTERGRLERVVVRRDGRERSIDLTDPANELREMQVRSGDQIVVQRRTDIFREYIAPTASIVAAVATVLRLFR